MSKTLQYCKKVFTLCKGILQNCDGSTFPPMDTLPDVMYSGHVTTSCRVDVCGTLQAGRDWNWGNCTSQWAARCLPEKSGGLLLQPTFSPEWDSLRSEQQEDHQRTPLPFVSFIFNRFLWRDACLLLSTTPPHLDAAGGQLAAALIREGDGKAIRIPPEAEIVSPNILLLWCAVIPEKCLENKNQKLATKKGKMGVPAGTDAPPWACLPCNTCPISFNQRIHFMMGKDS